MSKKVSFTTGHSIIGKVFRNQPYICSVCGKQMATTGMLDELKCEDGHKIGTLVEGERVSAQTDRKRGE